MPKEIESLIVSFEEWNLFANTLQKLNDKVWDSSIDVGKWSVRDTVSHIMCWDKYFYEEAIDKIYTDQQITLKHLDFDEFNLRSITFGRTILTNELLEMTVQYRKKIIDVIRKLSEEKINQNYIDGDGNIFNVTQYLKDFIWHDEHHMNPMKEFLAANKS